MSTQYNAKTILFSLIIVAFAGMFSETSLNIAITNLMEIFDIKASTAQWLTTGYLLTLGIVMPFTGALIQSFSTRKLFFFAASSLAIGTFIAPLSIHFGVLLFARILQAIGMGIMLPLIFNTVLVIFPVEKRGSAMGTIGLVLSFAPALGPAISGVLIQYMSWRFIFWLLLPFILIGMFIAYKNLENVTEVNKQPIDIISVITSTIGFSGIVYGFGELGASWTNPIAIGSVIIGLISLIIFIKRQNNPNPLLNLSVFKYPVYVMALLLVLMNIFVFMSTMIILPMFLQTGAGLSVFIAGLIILPGSIANGTIQLLGGKIFDKYGPKVLIAPGAIIMLIALYIFTHLTPQSSIISIILTHILLLAGVAAVWTAAQTHALNQLPSELYAHGSAVLNTALQVTGAIGTAIAVSVLTSGMNQHLSKVAHPDSLSNVSKAITVGSNHVFILLSIVVLLGLIMSLFMFKSRTKEAISK
ncbi:TPA: multidrug efflux MFS transporter [Staphylococcus aureus]|nr:multidrug efflux MFS transporter [Staphylococcus aureus]HEB2291476.1 multidrug efflux MFS transporter [Staphylococcus aureus]